MGEFRVVTTDRTLHFAYAQWRARPTTGSTTTSPPASVYPATDTVTASGIIPVRNRVLIKA